MEKHYKANISKEGEQFFLILHLPEEQKIHLSDTDQSSLICVFSYLVKTLIESNEQIVFDFETNDIDSGINEISQNYINLLNQEIRDVFQKIAESNQN